MKKFIRLPIIFHDIESEKAEECEDCRKEALDLGIDFKKFCPDCDEKQSFEETKSFETIDISNIRSFNPMSENTVRVCFESFGEYDCLKYELSEAELIEKLRQVGAEVLV